jgi:hypothetical protein
MNRSHTFLYESFTYNSFFSFLFYEISTFLYQFNQCRGSVFVLRIRMQVKISVRFWIHDFGKVQRTIYYQYKGSLRYLFLKGLGHEIIIALKWYGLIGLG